MSLHNACTVTAMICPGQPSHAAVEHFNLPRCNIIYRYTTATNIQALCCWCEKKDCRAYPVQG
jgi:hypothetical protein